MRELVREEGGRGDVGARDGGRIGDSVWWCLKGLRRELGRKERECGGGCRLKALKYFLSQKRDLLTECQWM